LPSLHNHRIPVRNDSGPSDQVAELNWYGGLHPDFYLKIFHVYPEVFPAYLHDRVELWLRRQLYHTVENLYSPVFLHLGYSSFSGGERPELEVLPSIRARKQVIASVKGRTVSTPFEYEHLSPV
jgi:hypothetical protein